MRMWLSETIKFFDEQTKDFVLKLIPLLEQVKYKQNDVVYEKSGDLS
jgi:hypothetical protein